MTTTTHLELVHDGETYHLAVARRPNGVHDVTLRGKVVATARRAKQNKWQAKSKKTGQVRGGVTLQKAVTQLFYDEVDQW